MGIKETTDVISSVLPFLAKPLHFPLECKLDRCHDELFYCLLILTSLRHCTPFNSEGGVNYTKCKPNITCVSIDKCGGDATCQNIERALSSIMHQRHVCPSDETLHFTQPKTNHSFTRPVWNSLQSDWNSMMTSCSFSFSTFQYSTFLNSCAHVMSNGVSHLKTKQQPRNLPVLA